MESSSCNNKRKREEHTVSDDLLAFRHRLIHQLNHHPLRRGFGYEFEKVNFDVLCKTRFVKYFNEVKNFDVEDDFFEWKDSIVRVYDLVQYASIKFFLKKMYDPDTIAFSSIENLHLLKNPRESMHNLHTVLLISKWLLNWFIKHKKLWSWIPRMDVNTATKELFDNLYVKCGSKLINGNTGLDLEMKFLLFNISENKPSNDWDEEAVMHLLRCLVQKILFFKPKTQDQSLGDTRKESVGIWKHLCDFIHFSVRRDVVPRSITHVAKMCEQALNSLLEKSKWPEFCWCVSDDDFDFKFSASRCLLVNPYSMKEMNDLDAKILLTGTRILEFMQQRDESPEEDKLFPTRPFLMLVFNTPEGNVTFKLVLKQGIFFRPILQEMALLEKDEGNLLKKFQLMITVKNGIAPLIEKLMDVAQRGELLMKSTLR